jgi:hypothetical protein
LVDKEKNLYLPKDINAYLTKIAKFVGKVPPDQVGRTLKRVFELEYDIDVKKPNPSDEMVAVFEYKPISDSMSGIGYERLMFEYFELEILKHTGEKFEEFYSKPRWYTRAMVEQIRKYVAAQKTKLPPEFS